MEATDTRQKFNINKRLVENVEKGFVEYRMQTSHNSKIYEKLSGSFKLVGLEQSMPRSFCTYCRKTGDEQRQFYSTSKTKYGMLFTTQNVSNAYGLIGVTESVQTRFIAGDQKKGF